jgi:hypothetical protein
MGNFNLFSLFYRKPLDLPRALCVLSPRRRERRKKTNSKNERTENMHPVQFVTRRARNLPLSSLNRRRRALPVSPARVVAIVAALAGVVALYALTR